MFLAAGNTPKSTKTKERKTSKKRKAARRDRDEEEDDDEDSGELDVVTEAEAEEEEAAGNRKGGKRYFAPKLGKLKRSLDTPDESYVNEDRTFDVSFMPFGKHGGFVIGYVPMLITVFPDADLLGLLGYKKPISTASKDICSHTCCDLNIHLAVKGASPELTETQRRLRLNERREAMKVVCNPRPAQLGFVMVAIKDGSKTSALTLADLSSPLLCYRIRVRFHDDALGTVNYPRAMIEPVEHFAAAQQMYERSIPISDSEYHKYFAISNNEGRGCLSNIPLLRNCAADFEFVEMVASTYPLASLADGKPESSALADGNAADAANNEEIPNTDLLRIFLEAQEKQAESSILADDDDNTEDEEANPLLLAQADEAMEEFGIESDNENDAELFGLTAESDDVDEDKDDKVAAPRAEAKPNLAAQIYAEVAKTHVGERSPTLPRPPPTTPIADVLAPPSVRRVEVNNRIRRIVETLREEPSDGRVCRPLSAHGVFRIYYGGRMRNTTLQLLFQRDSAEDKFNFNTAKSLAWSGYQKFPAHVDDWSKKLGVKQGMPQNQIAVPLAARAMLDFASSRHNLVMALRSKLVPATPIGVKCMENLGADYPHALGYLCGSTKDEITRRTKQAKNLIYGVATAGLMFAVEKYGLRREDENCRVPDDIVDQWRRVWSPLLPEKFWRVAILIGFAPTLYYLFNGALDHAFLFAQGPTPHQLVFASNIHRFFPKDPSKDVAPAAPRVYGNKRYASSSMSTDKEAPFLMSAKMFDVENTLAVEYQNKPNQILLLFSSLNDDSRHRILYTLAREICKRRATVYSNVDELFGLLKAAASMLTIFKLSTTDEISDTVMVNPFVFRESRELALFYPAVENCDLAVTARLPPTRNFDLAQIDSDVGLQTLNESWRTAPPSTLVHCAVVQTAANYNVNAGLTRCLFDSCAFAKYGVDCVRSDSAMHLARLCIQRIEYLLFDSNEKQMRFHCIFGDGAGPHNLLYDALAERVKQRPSRLWPLVCMFSEINTPVDNIFKMFESRSARFREMHDVERLIRSQKPFVYVPFADRLTANQLLTTLLSTTTRDYAKIGFNSNEDLTSAEKAKLDVFVAPTFNSLRGVRAVDDAEESFKTGVLGEYLYISGVALWRGTLLGAQSPAPSVFEDIYFSVEGGEAKQLPTHLNTLQFQDNKSRRLRCWFDYKLASCFSRTYADVATLGAEPGSACLPVELRFFDPVEHNRERIRTAVQAIANVEHLQNGIKGTPRNVWLEGRTFSDGKVIPGLLMRERSAALDRIVPSRIGLKPRALPVLSTANDCRIVAIDPIVGSAFIDVAPHYKKLLAWICPYEKRRQALASDESTEPSRATPLVAPSIAQMQSSLATSVTNWTGADVEQRLQQNVTEDMLVMNLHDFFRFNFRKMSQSVARLDKANEFIRSRLQLVRDVREAPTRGFGINQLISIFNERPDSVVVVGLLNETGRRCFEMRVRPIEEMTTSHERYIMEGSATQSVTLLDCYSLNSMSALPFMINVRVADGRDPGCSECLFEQ